MLRDLLGLSKEPVELEISEAAETLKTEKQSEIDGAVKKADVIRSDVIEEFEQLESNLEQFREFEDEKDRQVINDVVDNIVSDRLEMIDDLDFSEEPEELYNQLDKFITEFQSLKRKEAAVLEEAYLQKKISKTVGGLEDQRQRLSEFLETDYRVVTNYNQIKQILQTREKILDEIDELEDQIKKLEVNELELKIDNIEGKLDELKESSDWREYERLKDRVDEKESEREKVVSDLNTSLNKMERGLKKLIYEAENGDLNLKNIGMLERLQDKDADYILEHPGKTLKALESAEGSLPDDLLNKRQRKKFLESISEVSDLPEKSDYIDSAESRIQELEKKIENHAVIKQKKDLRSEKKRLENRLEDERKEKDSLEKNITEKQSELEDSEKRIRELIGESIDRPVEID